MKTIIEAAEKLLNKKTREITRINQVRGVCLNVPILEIEAEIDGIRTLLDEIGLATYKTNDGWKCGAK